MIFVQGASADSLLPQLSFEERAVFLKKQNSPYVYMYSSLDELRFELKLRMNTVYAAKAMQAGHSSFASFANSRANPAYWTVTEAGGFQLNSGVRPSDAIEDMFKQSELYAFECAAAIVIVLYKAVLDTIGPDAFNTLFQNLYIWSWNYDQDLRLVKHQRGESFPGDVRYFDNPEVDPATPEWQGENVVVLGDDLYFGHGIGITSSEPIIRALNRRRKPGATQSAFLMEDIIHPDYKTLYKAVITSTSPRQVKPDLSMVMEEEVCAWIGNTLYIR